MSANILPKNNYISNSSSIICFDFLHTSGTLLHQYHKTKMEKQSKITSFDFPSNKERKVHWHWQTVFRQDSIQHFFIKFRRRKNILQADLQPYPHLKIPRTNPAKMWTASLTVITYCYPACISGKLRSVLVMGNANKLYTVAGHYLYW